jgi:serine/threonine-protein kinase
VTLTARAIAVIRGSSVIELVAGLSVTDSIRLVRKLGEGGMGSVWVADHLALHTQVAVKFMTAELAHSPHAAARFQREARAAAQIKSPHVVQVFDHGLLERRVPYIVMELLEGESLASFIERHGTLSAQLTSQIVAQTCKALAKAHAGGVIHRDIKPDNVFLVDSDGEVFVKLLDFGIAKRLHENANMTSTGAVIGTLHYMSPEQLLGSKTIDARTDLWALGVVAYECLTGTVPFQGAAFGAIALAVMHDELALPHARLGIGSPALDAWLARVLSKAPAGRFATARETAEAFAVAAGQKAPMPSGPISMAHAGAPPRDSGAQARAPAEPDPGAAPRRFETAAPTFIGSRKRPIYVVVAIGLGLLGLGVAAMGLFMRRAVEAPPVSLSEHTAPFTPSEAGATTPAPIEASPIAAAPEAPPAVEAVDAGAPEAAPIEALDPPDKLLKPEASGPRPAPDRKSARPVPKSRRTPAPQATEEPRPAPSAPDRGF